MLFYTKQLVRPKTKIIKHTDQGLRHRMLKNVIDAKIKLLWESNGLSIQNNQGFLAPEKCVVFTEIPDR